MCSLSSMHLLSAKLLLCRCFMCHNNTQHVCENGVIVLCYRWLRRRWWRGGRHTYSKRGCSWSQEHCQQACRTGNWCCRGKPWVDVCCKLHCTRDTTFMVVCLGSLAEMKLHACRDSALPYKLMASRVYFPFCTQKCISLKSVLILCKWRE